MTVARSLTLFVVAALAEIGGAWLVWQGLREHRGLLWVGAGVAALGLYGFLATLQPDAHFGRILAAYGAFRRRLTVLGRRRRQGPARSVRRHRCRRLPRRRRHHHVRTARLTMTQANKAVVRQLVTDVMNAGDLDAIDDIYAPELSAAARRWIAPFRQAFPDVRMEIADLIAEGDKVVGRFRCSGTHRGRWRGQPATGRAFRDIAEVYIFTIQEGRIASAWGLEDTHARMRQLGLDSPGR